MLVSFPSNMFAMFWTLISQQIYRCYVIYSRRWLVIGFPIMLWLANLALSIVIIWLTSTTRTDTIITHQRPLKPFLCSFFSATIALNLIAIGMYFLGFPRTSDLHALLSYYCEPHLEC